MLLALIAAPVFAAYEITPCAVGNRWEYDTYKVFRGNIHFQGKVMAQINDASSGSSIYEVLSTEEKTNPTVFNYRETTHLQSAAGAGEENSTVDLRLSNNNQGMRVLSTVADSEDSKKSEKQSYDPPLLYYLKDAVSGKPWTVGVMTDSDTKAPMSAKAMGKETVTVPAGTFKDCLKVVYTSDEISGTTEVWGKQFNLTTGKSRGIYWIADGVGVVKELEVSTSTAESPGPDGTPITIDAATCTVSELRPGYTIKK